MFQVFALVWQKAQNGRLHKTGERTIRAACIPRIVFDRHFCCHFWLNKIFFLNRYPSIFVTGSLDPQQKRAYSALHPQSLTECSPLNFQRSKGLKHQIKRSEETGLITCVRLRNRWLTRWFLICSVTSTTRIISVIISVWFTIETKLTASDLK